MTDASRLVLRRASAQREVLAVAALVLLVSVVLVTACGVALRVASQAGVRAGLERAVPADRVVVVSGNPEDAAGLDTADAAVRDLLGDAVAPAEVDVDRRTVSATYALRGGAERDRLVLGVYDDVRAHTDLAEGSWPTAPGEVAVPRPATAPLDLGPGDRLDLLGQDGVPLRVTVTGVYSVRDPGEAYWAEDPQGAAGLRDEGDFRTFGPLLLPDDVDAGGVERLVDPRVSWLARPRLDPLSGAELDAVRGRVDEVEEGGGADLDDTLPDARVVTRLGDVLGDLGPSLDAARTAVAVPALLLLSLAVVSLVLAGRIVSEARGSDVALRESRGWSRGQVLRQAAWEMLALGLVVALAGPWLAPLLVRGVLSAAGTEAPATGLEPRDWLWAVVTVLGAVLLLTRAASSSSRPPRAATGWRRFLPQPRQVVEVVVVVLAVVAWQQATTGSAGPARAAAPALVVLALLLAVARLLPLAARTAGGLVSRTRGLVGPVVGWQLSRRAEHQRTALVTTGLAAAVGLFLAGLLGSWSASQADQAAVATGAQVRVTGLTTEEAGDLAARVEGAVVDRRSAGIGGGTGTVLLVAREDASGVLGSPVPGGWPRLLDRLAPDGEAVPVLVSSAVAEQAGRGDRLSLRVADASVPARVVGVLDAFPTARPGEAAVLVDREALGEVLGRLPGPAVSTDGSELWTRVPAAQVRPLAPGAQVLDRDAVAEDLRGGPVGTGLLAGSVLALVAAAMLGVLASASDTATTLRARRGELAALRAQGLSRRGVVTAVSAEHAALLAIAAVLGAVVGWVALRLLLTRLVVADTGELPSPAVETAVPWLLVVATALAVLVLLVAQVVLTAARAARRPLGADLRETT